MPEGHAFFSCNMYASKTRKSLFHAIHLKTVGETTEKLIDLQAKMKQLDKDDNTPDKVQTNLFVGSSAELQKLLKQNAQK